MLWPATGFTKGAAIDYYVRVSEALLPHLAGRPLTRVRFPNGVEEQRFYEKNAPKGAPDWVHTETLEMRKSEPVNFVVCDDLATLAWLAQLAALELHPSLSLAEGPHRPTVLAFDLDPGEPAGIAECCQVGLWLRGMFGELGLECFPKTSGSKGLQVYLPLNHDHPAIDYGVTKPFARMVAQTLEKAEPDLVVSRMTKKLRKGKVLVDWSQNDSAKTTVAVYSLRAREHPTVSTPVEWGEVEACLAGETELRFETEDVLERVKDRGDLFAPVLELEQELPSAT